MVLILGCWIQAVSTSASHELLMSLCVCGFTYWLRLTFNLYPTASQYVLQTAIRDICGFAVYPKNSWCHTYRGFGSLWALLMQDSVDTFNDTERLRDIPQTQTVSCCWLLGHTPRGTVVSLISPPSIKQDQFCIPWESLKGRILELLTPELEFDLNYPSHHL